MTGLASSVSRSVVIAICTYRRVGLLPNLLNEVMAQVRELPERFSVRVIVIDNDPDGSAGELLSQLRERMAVDFRHYHEAVPGVGNARNLAFSLVEQGEWLVFFDDDQIPATNWLQSLLESPDRFSGELFVGPVRPLLPDAYPSWAEGAWAWSRREYADGAVRRHAGFGNILISPSALADDACRVSTPYLNGPGEDTSVTSALSERGFILTHVRDAAAWEPVTPDRLRISWVTARARNAGRVWATMSLERKRGVPRLVLSGGGLIVCAVYFWIRSLTSRNSRYLVRSKAKMATAYGYLLAIRRRASTEVD